MTAHLPDDDAHPLPQSYPDFLRLLDVDPERAWSGFHVFAWKLLTTHLPAAFRDLPRETREEIISDMVLACREDDFRLLRNYRDQGTPFASWVARLAQNRALDRLRHQKVVERHRAAEVVASGGASELPDDAASNRQILDAVRQAIRRLGVRCRLLIEAAADELKPAEIARLLGNPLEDNKKVSDALRACRRTLRQILRQRGLEFGDGR
jgi:RNA polymerase sigma factor (sigma-70 family)